MGDLRTSRTGNDAVKLTLAKILTMAVGLVSSMLLSRFRTLAEYGTYSQINMAISLVSALLMLGLPNSINYFLSKAENEAEREKFLGTYYSVNTLLSFFVGLVLVLATPLLEKFFKNPFISAFWYFLAVYPWTKIVMSSVENLLVVYQKTLKLFVFKVTNSIALLVIIVLVQVFGGTFMQYMALFLLVETAFTVWTYFIVKENAPGFRFGINKKLVLAIFKFSIPIGLASMVGTIKIEMDKLVITSFMTTEDLAIYTNASKELPFTIVATSMSSVLLPQAVKLLKNNENRQAVSLWKTATTISFAVLSVAAIGCFTFAEEVMTILYSEKYLPGVDVFRVYCLVLLCRCTYFGLVLNATGKTKPIFFSAIGSLVVNVALNYILYFCVGFIGPAVATLVATVCMILCQLGFSCKLLKIKFREIFPWTNAGILLAQNIGLGIFFRFLKELIVAHIFDNNIVVAIAMGIIWVVAFAVMNYRMLKEHWSHLNKER